MPVIVVRGCEVAGANTGETGSGEEEQQQQKKEITKAKLNRKPVDSSVLSSSRAAAVLDYWRGEMAVTGDETESGRVDLTHLFACRQINR